jgi:hypothetical protein
MTVVLNGIHELLEHHISAIGSNVSIFSQGITDFRYTTMLNWHAFMTREGTQFAAI